jgi:RHS repeat-associated protein
LQNYLAESDATNAINVVYTNEPQQYGNLVSTRIGNTTSYHHFDALGSTRQLTGSNGVVSDTVIYDAWGNAATRTGATAIALVWIGQLGYYFDLETGLFVAGRRPYGPIIARWVTVDPLVFLDSINRYTYVQNRAIILVDPSGLKCRVCGSTKQFNVLIKDLDNTVEGNPYAGLAIFTRRRLQRFVDTALGSGEKIEIPALEHTGEYRETSTPQGQYLYGFLFFFISFEVCVEPFSECSLTLDESKSVNKITESLFNSTTKGIDQGEIVRISRGAAGNPIKEEFVRPDCAIATRVKYFGDCPTVIIYSDAPRGAIRKGNIRGFGFDNLTKQTFVIHSTERIPGQPIKIQDVYTLDNQVHIVGSKKDFTITFTY